MERDTLLNGVRVVSPLHFGQAVQSYVASIALGVERVLLVWACDSQSCSVPQVTPTVVVRI
ncbi:MAG: hypothetical protein ACI82F_003625 [Planctomycetota bacterium]|jgi:hypothetical protein